MSMLLDLGRLRGGVERVDRQFDPTAFGPAETEFRIVTPVVVSAEARKDAGKVRLAGHLSTTLECACSRCLEPLPVAVDSPFDLFFLPAPGTAAGGGEEEVSDDDLGVSYYKDDVIDLGEVVREQLFLALPMKPLCREDCRGLCPVCGANRNREVCTCEAEWRDPRLEPLRHLKSQ